MATKTKTKNDDVIGSVVFTTKTIRRKLYGVAAVVATIGGASLGDDLVAVRAGNEKHVNSREHAVAWLTKRGLSKDEAEEFVTMGLLAGETGAHDALKPFVTFLEVVGIRLHREAGGKDVSLAELAHKCFDKQKELAALAKKIDEAKKP